MNRIFKKFSILSALAATIFAAGCENIGQTTAPTLEPEPMVVMSTTGERYVVAMEWSPSAAEVKADVGPAGGVLMLGRHSLWVSSGAVAQVTTFKIQRDLAHPLRFKLSAGTDGQENNIGAAGFAPGKVKLGLSYHGLRNRPTTPEQMKILYFRPDGLVEPLPSQIQIGNHVVVAAIPHFSLFGLGWP